jgi:hypothetical protein
MTSMKLDWLDEGSLYLLLSENLLPEWHGVDSSDYQRACAAADNWLNVLPVGNGVGLVLGGDPGMALVTEGPEGDPLLVRWIYADEEEALVALAMEGEAVTRTEPDLVFESPAAEWRLFDAAADPLRHNASWRRVTLPVGRVRARSTYVEAEGHAAIVHRFSPEG